MKYPFDQKTPLFASPFFSRIGNNEFRTGVDAKNYVMVAFAPGAILQASELNEIQETYYKNLTLHNMLLRNWIFIGDPKFTSGNPAIPVFGPSWSGGAVPLHPFNSVVVNYETNIVTLKKDWYLVDDKSGIKFWIYNNVERTITVSAENSYVGVSVSMEYNTTDPGLSDNSNGYITPMQDEEQNMHHTGRYQMNITGLTTSNTLTSTQRHMFRKTTVDGIVNYRYLNNLLYKKD